MSDYETFLQTKRASCPTYGPAELPASLHPGLRDFQAFAVRWAFRRGRAALFQDCGLGKTFQQLEWARMVHLHTGGKVLILTPLAVAAQTLREAERWVVPAVVARQHSECGPAITIANYERLSKFDSSAFAGVVLDESSILKSFMGKTKRALLDAFAATPFRLACTATPAPNDFIELGNHADFLGIMPANQMLMRWFINDTMSFGTWRLKHHAAGDFWRWVASWAACCGKPSDLGDFDDSGYILPPHELKEVVVQVDISAGAEDTLFRIPDESATGIHDEMRRTAADRAAAAAKIANGTSEPVVVWCNTNYEADELMARIPDAVEVRGSDKAEEKEGKLTAFSTGQARVIITKPSIAGFGLNWQHCAIGIHVGLSYSYEELYQAMRRIYRFGQTRQVTSYVITAATEHRVMAAIKEKMQQHDEMRAGMASAAKRITQGEDLSMLMDYDEKTSTGAGWEMRNGDCVDIVRSLPDNHIGFSVFSPPFANLYIYSDSVRDMGNCEDDAQFMQQFGFLISELHRVTKPGRLCAVHCKQLVNYKGRDGMAGLRDFRGEIIKEFIAKGWAYHSEVTIWKDPVIEMQRTKAHGLLYKQLRTDSTFSRNGMAEYVCVFRKWAKDGEEVSPVGHKPEDFPLDDWQQIASPVWMDIQQTNVLNARIARADQDEKHLCPLQLDVIERCLRLWSNPGDLVLSPFAGIGSEGYVSLKMGRRFIGAELKREYFQQACSNLHEIELEATAQTKLDFQATA